jgi:cobalt-zinc-cadmium resistance protein CzcA
MFDKIVVYSIKNKLVVGLFVVIAMVAGAISLKNLPIDAVPDVTNNQIVVLTQAPTLATQEVERFITAPLEIQFLNIQKIEDVRSISRQGLSVITLVFSEDIDLYLARQLVTEQIKMAEEHIPASFGKPELAPITTGLGEIYQYTLDVSDAQKGKFDLTELRTLQDWIVKKQLSGIEGVTEISSFGGFVKQFEIGIELQKMYELDISIQEVFDAVNANNSNTGGSYIEKNDQNIFIRGEGLATSFQDLENIVIKNEFGVPILVKNIAKVQIGHAKRFGAMTKNGEGEAVGGIVLMLKGADSEKTIKKVKERITQINASLPSGVKITPFIDRTKLIDKSIKTVRNNLLEGGLIVVFVLILLMGSIRAGILVASVIPITMLITFGLMQYFGITANLMSLGAIDFGLLVDCSVIVVEGVLFKLHSDKTFKDRNLSVSEFDEIVGKSASKVLSAALFGGLIILIVYLPILSLSGVEGKMFKPMASTVSLALIVAIVLSLTYIPAASAFLLRNEGKKAFKLSDKIVNSMFKVYFPIFEKAILHYKKVIIFSILVFAFSLWVFLRMGGEFIPTLDEGDLAVDFQTPQGSSLSATIAATTKAQKALLENFPEIDQIVGRIGASEIPTDPMPPEMSDLMINLKDHSEWTSAENSEELANKMAEVLAKEVPGTSVEFTQPIQMRFNEMIAGSKSEFAIKIFGDDLEVLAKKGAEIEKVLYKIEGTKSVKVERIEGLPQINIKINKEKMAEFGISVDEVNFLIKTALAGTEAGVIFEEERRFDVVIRNNQNVEIDIDKIKNMKIKTISGSLINFDALADIDYKMAPPQISRERARRRLIIGVGIGDRDIESYVDEVAIKLNEKIKLPIGYFIEYGGSFENLVRAKERLTYAVPLAMILIFVLLYFSLKSIPQALLVFSAVPFSAIGGVMALQLRGMPFSISAGVGFIALFGVAVLNGLVLISYFNQSQENNIIERITEGVKARFRPVMITAFVASLGFLPMAISTSAGAEVQKPLATVVIGGLITATLLTLIVLPLIYMIYLKSSTKKP